MPDPSPTRDAETILPDGRDETPEQRADRNWNEVLQVRVLQTGSQILAAFLLALAFQPAFADLDDRQRAFYLALIVLACLTAIVALAPVALHRALFQRRAKQTVVAYGHAAIVTALVTLSFLLTGVAAFVFDVVLGAAAAWAAAIVLGVVVVLLWLIVPAVLRRTRRG